LTSHLESFGLSFLSLTTVADDVISFSSFCLRLWKSSGRRGVARDCATTLRSGVVDRLRTATQKTFRWRCTIRYDRRV